MNRSEILALLSLATEREEGDQATEHANVTELARLTEAGLISETGVVSEKGEAYIRALEGVPQPVLRWCLPSDHGRAVEPIAEFDVTATPPAQPTKGKKRGNRT